MDDQPQVWRVLQSQRRRERILRAALQSFNRLGYERTSINEIRLESGASVGSIYHHFRDKEGIAAALELKAHLRYRGKLVVILRAPEMDALASIEAAIAHHFRWIEEQPELARFAPAPTSGGGAGGSSAPMVEDDEPVTIATGHWIERHVRSGVFAPVEPELALTILLGPAFAYGRLHVAHRAATSLATARAALVRAAWRGLAAD